jgi:hypothetical protein
MSGLIQCMKKFALIAQMLQSGEFSEAETHRCGFLEMFFHLQQNAQFKLTQVNQRKKVADAMRSIFNQQSAEEAVNEWKNINPKCANWMNTSCRESFYYFKSPQNVPILNNTKVQASTYFISAACNFPYSSTFSVPGLKMTRLGLIFNNSSDK